ncbi:MAG TPA: hypothetical protein EYG65_00635 [Rhodospirillales bacterium]|nr:hypothetical protein [Rhodospirillales bacterium]
MGPVQPEASVVQTGLGIRYIGDSTVGHCYAYSGLYSANQVAVTVLDYTTGSGYVRGEFELHGFVDDDDPGNKSAASALINFNGEGVGIISTVSYRSPVYSKIKFIVPPFTRVTVSLDAENTEADRYASVTFTGRVYGAM